jgi:rSAM/selenodomain-associated transferase 1
MTVGLAIFVKTPGFSPVKTRLAATIGPTAAESLHYRMAATVMDVVRQAQSGGLLLSYWAIAEESAIASSVWKGLPVLAQGDGGLGERLDRVYRCLLERHQAVLLIGADAPQLTSASLIQGSEWLQSAESRCVLGPCHDGGFWLFGGNRPISTEAWTAIAYSQQDTARQLRDAIGNAGIAWHELPGLMDIDSHDDLLPVADALHALPQPLPKQIQLAHFLNQLATIRIEA